MSEEDKLLQKITEMVNNQMDKTTEKYAVSKYEEWSGLISKVEKGIQKVVSDVSVLRGDVNDLRKLVEPINEMKHKIDVEYPLKHQEHEHQLSNLTSDTKTGKKIMAWVAASIGAILLAAFFSLILKV